VIIVGYEPLDVHAANAWSRNAMVRDRLAHAESNLRAARGAEIERDGLEGWNPGGTPEEPRRLSCEAWISQPGDPAAFDGALGEL